LWNLSGSAINYTAGNVVIGGTTPVNAAAGTGNLTINGSSNAILNYTVAGSPKGWIYHDGTNFEMYNNIAGSIKLFTNGTERMRIDSGGNFLVGGTTPIGTDGNLIASADYTSTYRSTGTSGAYIHAFASDIGGTRTVKYAVYANGTVGAVSDQNFKKNIEPARNYLADLMNIEVVKYNWKSDEEDAPKELGYIAQQVETVFAGMVDEQTYKNGNGEEVTQKMLKKEVFVPMLLKAMQEQQAIIEDLKSRIEVLEAK
jgi:hypothetical protein